MSLNKQNHNSDQKLHLYVNSTKKNIELIIQGSVVASSKLSFNAIHSIFESVKGQLLTNGMSLHLCLKDLATPLGFESLLQTIMINMVSCIFPKICGWSPLHKKNFRLRHIDAEINDIRNAAYWNKINHVHTLKDILAGQPLLMALPGPSLDLDYIKEHRSAYAVMTAGRGAKTLLEAGIYPDIIYIQDVQSFAWHNNFGMLKDNPIPSILVANPLGRIWKYHHLFKKVYKSWNLYPFEQDIFPKIDEIAPSSVSGAYSLARLLGADPIIFIGNDCGTPIASPQKTTGPYAFTNLDFETYGSDLIFSPTSYLRNIHLHFGDELSVATKNDYLAGAQWLKIKANRDIQRHGIKIYDRSQTKLIQFLSLIQDASKIQDKFIHNFIIDDYLNTSKEYKTFYDIKKYLIHKKKTYEFILRILKSGKTPKSIFIPPLSSVFTNTSFAKSESNNITDDDFLTATINTEHLIEHTDISLSTFFNQ